MVASKIKRLIAVILLAGVSIQLLSVWLVADRSPPGEPPRKTVAGVVRTSNRSPGASDGNTSEQPSRRVREDSEAAVVSLRPKSTAVIRTPGTAKGDVVVPEPHLTQRESYVTVGTAANANVNENKDIAGASKIVTNMSVAALHQLVASTNEKQTILNAELFPISAEDRREQVVIVVQVHNRYDFLRALLKNLAEVANVSRALLIISADFVSDDLLTIVDDIKFCQVMMILSPHTSQLYPNSFPGTDPKDCPARISRAQALQTNCLNAKSPDTYGHFREAKFSSIKLHWWWKAAFVFRHVRVLGIHTGWVLMLEEDHLLSKDSIFVLRQLMSIAKEKPDVDILNLGRQKSQSPNVGNAYSEVSWTSPSNNMGFAFKKSTYDALAACSKEFCHYDDYNWDWTFHVVGFRCRKRPWKALVADLPRVFHIGTCGIHSKHICEVASEEARVNGFFRSHSEQLFPASMVFSPGQKQRQVGDPPKPNGGWGDWRDHELCMNISQS